jgi:adenylate cyclase
MSIKVKIVLVILPLMVLTIGITGVSSFFSATSGINRIARDFLGFKADELEKYALSQWAIIQQVQTQAELDDTGDTDFTFLSYLEGAKAGVESYARSIIRSDTEHIVIIDSSGNERIIFNPQGELNFDPETMSFQEGEKDGLIVAINHSSAALITLPLAGDERVGKGFYFEPFNQYYFVSESTATFFQDINNITIQTLIILAASVVVSLFILLFLAARLTNPLIKVVDTMKEIISTNNLDKRVEVQFSDETGVLAHTFNIMTGELDKAYKEIKRFAFQAVLAKKNETKVRTIFQKFVPQELIEKFLGSPESLLIGEDRVLSILFSDIRSFTTISEGMHPNDLVSNLNRYFEVMVDTITDRKGVVDKYIGDAIMAFFGAPVKYDDFALQSVMAGIDMVEKSAEFNKKQEADGNPPFNIGIGINYGYVTVGNIGTDKKMDYTVIGDMVNLASRLEGLTKEFSKP